jgi:multidrug transporter EmrE-like cation transporter
MFWFHEPRDAFRLVSMALVVAGILGLKFTAKA